MMVGYQDSLQKWARHRESGGSRLYSKTSSQILQWIAYLWALYTARYNRCLNYDGSLARAIAQADISFFMLEPNPETRITARKLLELTLNPNTRFYELIGKQGCRSCQIFHSAWKGNFPQYATFRSEEEISCQDDPKMEL